MSSTGRKVRGLLTLGLIAFTTPVIAAGQGGYTGASLISDTTAFSLGFAWGTVTGYLNYGAAETPENVDKIGKCLLDGHITSGVFKDAVVGVINADPSLLAKDATAAVLTTLYKICPVR